MSPDPWAPAPALSRRAIGLRLGAMLFALALGALLAWRASL